MTSSRELSASGSVASEIFAYSGIECRLTVSRSASGFAAMGYCPYCGKAIGGGTLDANQESAVSQMKAEFPNHLAHCPMRNADRPPLGVKPKSAASDHTGTHAVGFD